ncbi:helix-turn-helix transcriptional regulator [Dyadobacter flavalbus]|uniref:Helix-turn-helix transcriptional regulator n=1 Tax=Dyadobacter flavalbus TaxID=2579942 RepID=A0A5M8R177_9BACT|nr:helix-turn-helix transcriptional regulator [Dyadobacter flavalbus]KAA6440734.1 helix-turn-helix transcriptional regulator [Dyadobacter flavalbus]
MAGFNEKMRSIRMMRGIKQNEIAELLNVKQQSVSKIESGKIHISKDTANKIANHFGFASKEEMEIFYEKNICQSSRKANQKREFT